MKISDAIKELQQLQASHGDLQIHTFDDEVSDFLTPNFEVVDPTVDDFCVENKGQLSIGSSLFIFIN